MKGIEVEGIEVLEKKIKRLNGNVKERAIKRVLKIGAKPLVSAVKAETPVGKRTRRVRGKTYKPKNLKKSVGIINTKSKHLVLIGPRAGKKLASDGYYGHMVHDGTANQTANPFMERGERKAGSSVARNTAKQMARAVQREIDKLSR